MIPENDEAFQNFYKVRILYKFKLLQPPLIYTALKIEDVS
jgi:hypothetical protein